MPARRPYRGFSRFLSACNRTRNAALCGRHLDCSGALLVQRSITCSVGSVSEKSVSDAWKRQRERRAFFTPHVPKLSSEQLRSQPPAAASACGTRSRGKEKHVLGTEQSDRPPPPRGTVEGGHARRR